jgi:hypothetical protein
LDTTVAIRDQCEAESTQKVFEIMAVFVYQLIEVGRREERWGDIIFLFMIVKDIPRHIGKNILQY